MGRGRGAWVGLGLARFLRHARAMPLVSMQDSYQGGMVGRCAGKTPVARGLAGRVGKRPRLTSVLFSGQVSS